MVNGRIEPSEARWLNDHLEDCENCRSELAAQLEKSENELAEARELVSVDDPEMGRQLDDRLEASVLPTQLGDLS